MSRNVEVKAKLHERAAVEAAVRGLADQGPTELRQDDTFFRCPSGRLKLRTDGSKSGELIHYSRPDPPGPSCRSTRVRWSPTPRLFAGS
jgi:adenylate cyclase class IV